MSSWRAIGTVIGRAVRVVTERVISAYSRWSIFVPKAAPKVAGKLTKHAATQVRLPPRARPITALGKLLSRSMIRSGQTAVRAASLALWHQRHLHADVHPSHRRHLWRDDNLLLSIRNLLHRTVAEPDTSSADLSHVDASRLPHDIQAYDITDYICHGCNGAVYSARLKPNAVISESSFLHNSIDTTTMMPRLRKLLPPDETDLTPLQTSPMVIKLLFNYNYLASVNQIWWDNENEIVPVMDKRLHGRFRGVKLLSSNEHHSNIVKLYTAFVDEMPILPRAAELYPAALPPDLLLTSQQPLQTMFLILKRYNMTLREYLLTRQPSAISSHVMFAQLLEACEFLHRQNVSHRDLKSDNILLECEADEPDSPPFLVVSDFGSCMSTGSMQQTYFSDECDLGGNVCLRAPEIRRAKPSADTKLDYSAADLWACGTLAYEMFSRMNPFYSTLRSDEYKMEDVPEMPNHTPQIIKCLVNQIINIDPHQRPSVSLCASVAVLSLMRMRDQLNSLLYAIRSALSEQSHKLTNDFLGLFAVETLMGTRCNRMVSKAEAQVRYTWLQRINYEQLKPALDLMYTYNASIYSKPQ